jgi:trans-2,3-dihydro-3-hydroxyanthranilate isomerase
MSSSLCFRRFLMTHFNRFVKRRQVTNAHLYEVFKDERLEKQQEEVYIHSQSRLRHIHIQGVRDLMRTLHFKHVDVFTSIPLQGNGLVVFPDAADLTGEEMQKVAREFNLSETTFVSNPTSPEANYKMRIFTPALELPFAGHPSVGTAYVLAKEGKRFPLTSPVTHITQEIGIGVLPLEIQYDGAQVGRVDMTQGTPKVGRKVEDVQKLADLLKVSVKDIESTGLSPQVSSTGVNQLMVPMSRLKAVANLRPDLNGLVDFAKEMECDAGIYIFTRETINREADIHARFFAPDVGVSEDPATGSAAGALGAYLASSGSLPHETGEFVVEQGIEIGRPSLINVQAQQAEKGLVVKVGGHVVDVIEGQITI